MASFAIEGLLPGYGVSDFDADLSNEQFDEFRLGPSPVEVLYVQTGTNTTDYQTDVALTKMELVTGGYMYDIENEARLDVTVKANPTGDGRQATIEGTIPANTFCILVLIGEKRFEQHL